MLADDLRETTGGGSFERKCAPLAQWIVFLALSTSIGFAWSGFYLLVARTFGEISLVSILDRTLFWFLGTSFTVGVTYRLFAWRKRRLPSIWFATVMPGIGALFSVGLEGIRTASDMPSLIMGMIAALGIAYVCGGIFLIPLSILHTKALEWVHVKTTDWAPRASVRSIRQIGYATLCLGVLIASETPRYLDMKAREGAQTVAEMYEIKMPETARLLNSRESFDPDSPQDAHFRVPGGMAWPPKESALGMSAQEGEKHVYERFANVAHQDVPWNAELERVKWYEQGGGWVEASRLRAPEADYVEIRRHP